MTAPAAVATALGTVLFALAALHVWWAMGHQLGDSVVIPKVAGRPAFTPSRSSTLVVAALLLAATTVALWQGQLLPDVLPHAPLRWAAMAAGTAFLLRALGEFRLVGFFKRVRNTDFARWDTWCFSPLSASMGSAFWYLAYAGQR
jgi:hypothetical protein